MKLRIQDMSKATGVMLSVFTVVTLLIHPLDPLLQRATFVFLSTVMAFLKVLDQKKRCQGVVQKLLGVADLAERGVVALYSL